MTDEDADKMGLGCGQGKYEIIKLKVRGRTIDMTFKSVKMFNCLIIEDRRTILPSVNYIRRLLCKE
jgi:hypothetical protein